MATAAKRGRNLSGEIPAGVVDPANTALDPELVDAALSDLERQTAWEARHEGMWDQLNADEAREAPAREAEEKAARKRSRRASHAGKFAWSLPARDAAAEAAAAGEEDEAVDEDDDNDMDEVIPGKSSEDAYACRQNILRIAKQHVVETEVPTTGWTKNKVKVAVMASKEGEPGYSEATIKRVIRANWADILAAQRS